MFSIALGLIALTGGMFLLAKTTKDNLGVFFKIIAYFIIVASFINMACVAAHGAMKFYGKAHFGHEMMMHEKFMRYGTGFYQDRGMEKYSHWCHANSCDYEEGCRNAKGDECCGKCRGEAKDSCVTGKGKEKNEKK